MRSHTTFTYTFQDIFGVSRSSLVITVLTTGEFTLSQAKTYTAAASDHNSVTLDDVQFVYRETPDSSALVAYGKERVAKATFDTEVVAGPEGPRITGKSKNQVQTGS